MSDKCETQIINDDFIRDEYQLYTKMNTNKMCRFYKLTSFYKFRNIDKCDEIKRLSKHI